MRTLELFLFFSFCLVLASCSASSPNPTNQKPESIVVPVSVLGEVSGVRSQILQNTLNETISTKFRIVPQEKFEEAQESAFQEMDYDQCTEGQCFMLIQDMLQVQFLFHLEVVADGDLTQLSLKLVDLDEKKTITDACEKCTTMQLSERTRKLTERLLTEVDIITMDEIGEESQESKQKDELKFESESEKKAKSMDGEKWNLRIRGIYGDYSKKDLSIRNVSYALSWKGFGLGTSAFKQTMKSSSGNQYTVNANFIDSFIILGDRFTGTAGIGWANSGKAEIKSSQQSYQSEQVYGLKYFGLLAYQWGVFESMFGYQYLQLRYRQIRNVQSGFDLKNPLYVFGGLFMFGLGLEF